MIAPTKTEKETYLKFILDRLWRGQTKAGLDYLRAAVKTKNPEKLTELIGYIEKHQSEIIDYQRRQRSGKVIGSGRIEKCGDQVIDHRQKKKGSCKFSSDAFVRQPQLVALALSEPTTGSDHPNLSLENLQEEKKG